MWVALFPGAPFPGGNGLGKLGIAYKNLGEPRKAVEYYEQALVIDREIGDRRGEGTDLWNMEVVGEAWRLVFWLVEVAILGGLWFNYGHSFFALVMRV